MKSHIDPAKYLLCPDCDMLLEKVPASHGERLECPRCSCVLMSPSDNSVEKTMALTLSGLILYIPANFLPLITFDAIGMKSTGTIWDSWLGLIHADFIFTGIMVLFTSILIPLAKLLMLLTVTWHIQSGCSTRNTAILFRWYHHLDEWGMLEVYMIGILVTIIKMLHMAHVEYDMGFFCFIGLLAATLCSSAAMDRYYFWEQIDMQASGRKQRAGIQGCSEKISSTCIQAGQDTGI